MVIQDQIRAPALLFEPFGLHAVLMPRDRRQDDARQLRENGVPFFHPFPLFLHIIDRP